MTFSSPLLRYSHRNGLNRQNMRATLLSTPQLADPFEIIGILDLQIDHVVYYVTCVHLNDDQSGQDDAADLTERLTHQMSQVIQL